MPSFSQTGEPGVTVSALRVTVAEDFHSLAEAWSELLDRSNSDMVCLTPEWISSWWEAFGGGKTPLVLTVWHGQRLVALAPLMVVKVCPRTLSLRRLQFMTNEHSPRADIITDSSLTRPALHAIFDYLDAHRGEWDIIELKRMPRDTGTSEVLEQILKDMPLRYEVEPSLQSPYILIEGDWNTYYAGRSANFRKSMRNKLNRVKRIGESVVEQSQDEPSLKSALTTIFELSRKSWKGTQHSGIGSTEISRTFYQALADHAGPKGWLRIWLLRVAGNPIAFECHLVYQDKAYALSSDFDEAYRSCTPGSVLDRLIIEKYFRADLKEYDMCGVDYPYKLRWTSTVREHVDVRIYHSRPVSELCCFWQHTMVPRLRSLKSLKSWKDRWGPAQTSAE